MFLYQSEFEVFWESEFSRGNFLINSCNCSSLSSGDIFLVFSFDSFKKLSLLSSDEYKFELKKKIIVKMKLKISFIQLKFPQFAFLRYLKFL